MDVNMKESSRSNADRVEPKPAAHAHGEGEEPEMLPGSVRPPRTVWVLLSFLALGAVIAVLFVTGWMPLNKRQQELVVDANTVKSAPMRVAVTTPQRSAASRELLLPAQIQATRETTIYARTSGYLKRWHVDMGDSVKAGQLLAEIDSPEIDMQVQHALAAVLQSKAAVKQAEAATEQARAQLINAQASAELADLTMKRYDSLRGTNSVSEQDISEKETAAKVAHAAVESNKAAVLAAEANINAAKANVEAADAEVRRVEVLKSFQKVTAPFDGTINQRSIEEGALITEGSSTTAQALFRLSSTNPVRVFLDIPQYYAPLIKNGMEVQLLVREFPGRAYSGVVARTSRSIDQAARTLRTEIHVPNPNGELLNGMYAQVKLKIVHDTPPLLLPTSALVVNAQGNFVALVHDQHVTFKAVELEGDYGSTFGVLGISESDQVIANPSERLRDGMAVEVVVTPKK